jgi:hypothetical protein
LKIYTPSTQIEQTLYTQPGVTRAQITKQNSYIPTNTEQEPHMNQSHRQTGDIQELKNMTKSLFEQLGTMLNPSQTYSPSYKPSSWNCLRWNRNNNKKFHQASQAK